MPALDHRAARPHEPFIAARSTKDPYSQMMLYRSRSPSPSRGDNELIMRGQAAKRGKNSAIAIALTGIQHTLEKRSLDLRLSVLGADDSTIQFMINLSEEWYSRGLFGEVESLHIRIVDASREKLGETHKNSLQAMHNLGKTWSRQGKTSDSERLKLQVYNNSREVLGNEDPQTLLAWLELTRSWQKLGRHNDAETAQWQIVRQSTEILGAKHPKTVAAIGDRAYTLFLLGRLEEAEAAKRQVLELSQEILGPKHRNTIRAMAGLASTWHVQGRYEEAELLTRQAHELRKEVLGPRHPEAIGDMHGLAMTWYALNRFEEAETLMGDAVDMRKQILGEEHPRTIHSVEKLTWMQQQREEREARPAEDIVELPGSVVDSAALEGSDAWVTEDEASDMEESNDQGSDAWGTDEEYSIYAPDDMGPPLAPLRRPAKAMLDDRERRTKELQKAGRRRGARQRGLAECSSCTPGKFVGGTALALQLRTRDSRLYEWVCFAIVLLVALTLCAQRWA